VLPDGRLMVTGGSNNDRTSFYVKGRWERGGNLQIGRGYHSNTVLQDGGVFLMGGSWYDGQRPSDFRILYGPFWGPLWWDMRYGPKTRWLFDWLFPWPRKDGEVWDPMTEQWRHLQNVKCIGSVVTNDVQGQYSNDNHMWLFQAPNGKIFQAGPSKMTHWITTEGDGSIVDAVRRGSKDAMNGRSVGRWDIGHTA
jgi:galactose oxidase